MPQKTIFHKIYAGIKKVTPAFISAPLRSVLTMLGTPYYTAYQNGFLKSALWNRAVDKNGEPLPWYTYPAIYFLSSKNFDAKTVLEFGAGQSTYWWAKRCRRVISMEGDKDWFQGMKDNKPANAELYFVSDRNAESCLEDVKKAIAASGQLKFDIIVIDGLWREALSEFAISLLREDGVIICDNAESYGFHEVLKKHTELKRVDFWGNAPGVSLEYSTSIYFKDTSFLFSAQSPIELGF